MTEYLQLKNNYVSLQFRRAVVSELQIQPSMKLKQQKQI